MLSKILVMVFILSIAGFVYAQRAGFGKLDRGISGNLAN